MGCGIWAQVLLLSTQHDIDCSQFTAAESVFFTRCTQWTVIRYLPPSSSCVQGFVNCRRLHTAASLMQQLDQPGFASVVRSWTGGERHPVGSRPAHPIRRSHI
ncbi:hypothetical protein BT67DRAFT_30088 [Trichocladium antarcticum]|uniref:Uncharacterized protein n=1 Tax=Trichocladium antarcticum TaxID=1450529 RepID=A0AAN6UUR8_9PEZI|nr:hypothetical protein BT67DRAFT_30088 [Trichocladium antarcticum]